MVMRDYGSKVKLFAVAVDVQLQLPDLTAIPTRHLGEALVAHFLRRWEGDPTDDALLMLLRSAATDDFAAERMRAIFPDQLTPALLSLTAHPPHAPRPPAPIAPQMLGLALCRNILRLPPVSGLDPEPVVAMIGPTIQRYLTAPLLPG